MAFDHGKKGRVILGQYDVSAFLKDFAASQPIDLAEVTVLTNDSKNFVVGQGDGKVSLGGFFAGGPAEVDFIMATFKAATAPWAFTVAPVGYGTVGSRVRIGKGTLNSYEISGSHSDAVGVSAEIQADDDAQSGVLLADLASRSATLTGTAVDNAAATTNGGIAVVHMAAYAGITNIVCKVQHSVNNSVWADLATFATLTGVGQEWVKVPAGTTVDRYCRALMTITGVGTYTASMSFARS